jgi:hypothetical protein
MPAALIAKARTKDNSTGDTELGRRTVTTKRQPDLIASITFLSSEDGGRRAAIPPRIFRCPLKFEGEMFDCGLHPEETGPVPAGATVTVPITLLFPELVKPRLRLGSRFTLWDLRTIAEGIVTKIL